MRRTERGPLLGVVALACAAIAVFITAVGATGDAARDPFVVAREAYDKSNFGTAREQFRVLADLGQAKAQTMMGHIYVAPRAVRQDFAIADHWYALAAAQGEPNAQLAHARLGLTDMLFVLPQQQVQPLDPAVALDLLRKAANQGLTEAMVVLASALADPKLDVVMRGSMIWARDASIPKNDAEAVAWLRKAAEQGDTGAQQMQGFRYFEGGGVAQNNAEAYFWFSIVAACTPPPPPGVAEIFKNTPLAGLQNAVPERDQARRRLSRQQVRDVDERLSKWRPTPEPNFGTALETPAERAQAKAAGPLCEPASP